MTDPDASIGAPVEAFIRLIRAQRRSAASPVRQMVRTA
jgi:hypothetical protein